MFPFIENFSDNSCKYFSDAYFDEDSFTVTVDGSVEYHDDQTPPTEKEINDKIVKLQAEIAALKDHQHDAPVSASTAPVPGDATSERLEKVAQQLRKQFPGSPVYKGI